jgi:monoamine oxidase
VVVLESRGAPGGRVSTTRGDDGEPLFNNFAWRVSETNAKMIALAKELNIKLVPQYTPPAEDEEKGHGDCRHGVLSSMGCQSGKVQRDVLVPNRAPLSDFAAAALEDSAGAADRQDRESGYAGRTSQVRLA